MIDFSIKIFFFWQSESIMVNNCSTYFSFLGAFADIYYVVSQMEFVEMGREEEDDDEEDFHMRR